MKQINEYLNTKVNKVNNEFPKTAMLDYIINFFRKNNFEEINSKRNRSLSIYDFIIFAENGKKAYGIYNNSRYVIIYFCFEGNITFENPLFMLCIQNDEYAWIAKDYFVNNNEKSSHMTYTYNQDGNDFDAFFKEVNDKL